jgi:hypothetical protein
LELPGCSLSKSTKPIVLVSDVLKKERRGSNPADCIKLGLTLQVLAENSISFSLQETKRRVTKIKR